MEQRSIIANGLEFAYLEDGPADGPLALCLHGFPDSAPTWRHLLPELAEAGYHAVAPWLRGYAPTALPIDKQFQVGALVADVRSLHEVLGGRSDSILIGHDWGALTLYNAAANQPDRWSRVVAMAVPPAPALMAGFFEFEQLKRSWYVFFFQTPIAEMAVAMDDLAFIDHLWADWSPGYECAQDLANVKSAIRDPERLTAAITYYRAMLNPELHDPALAVEQAAGNSPTPQPALYIHGSDDGCMGLDVIGDVMPFLGPGSKQVTIEGAGHFLHLERPDEVRDQILNFLEA